VYLAFTLSPTITSARAFFSLPIVTTVLSFVESATSFFLLFTVRVPAVASTVTTSPETCFTIAGASFFSAGTVAVAAFFASTAKETEVTANTKSTATIIAIAFFIKITSFHHRVYSVCNPNSYFQRLLIY
jgi:uncharacterized membrane protein